MSTWKGDWRQRIHMAQLTYQCRCRGFKILTLCSACQRKGAEGSTEKFERLNSIGYSPEKTALPPLLCIVKCHHLYNDFRVAISALIFTDSVNCAWIIGDVIDYDKSGRERVEKWIFQTCKLSVQDKLTESLSIAEIGIVPYYSYDVREGFKKPNRAQMFFHTSSVILRKYIVAKWKNVYLEYWRIVRKVIYF